MSTTTYIIKVLRKDFIFNDYDFIQFCFNNGYK